jgi:DNA-binding MarR family transcriptional regulator
METDHTDFIKRQGLSFFAHLLRRLSDDFVRAYDAWSPEVGLVSPTRTRSTLLALSEHPVLSMSELAALIRQSVPLVFTWVRQLKELGLISSAPDENDRRRTMLRLTKRGEQEVARLRSLEEVEERAYLDLLNEAGVDAALFEALWRLEALGRQRGLEERLREHQHSAAEPPTANAGTGS